MLESFHYLRAIFINLLSLILFIFVDSVARSIWRVSRTMGPQYCFRKRKFLAFEENDVSEKWQKVTRFPLISRHDKGRATSLF